MLDDIEINELAKQQSVYVLEDFHKLKADFWPHGETVEKFVSAIQHGCDDDQSRVN